MKMHRAWLGSREGRWKSAALLILLSWVFFAGCSKDGGDGAPNGEVEDPEEENDLVPVETVRLGRGEIEAVLRFSTNLEAESEVQVFSQAARRVTELRVEEGDRVRKDQPLLRLQDDEQRSQLARVESQLGRARREYKRQQSLYRQSLISEQAMNDATYEVEQLELAVDDARRALSYTEVRAPISGIVTGRHVNLGDHITVNRHLFDIVDFDTIVARVYVPENELTQLGVGQEARLYSNSLGVEADAQTADTRTAARIGKVARIAPIVDPRSGTVKVTVAIPRNQGLLPGMYVEVELVTEVHDDALLVPKRAVIYDNNQAFLYRLAEDLRAEKLRIDILLEDRANVEPAGSELELGDEIVVAGQAGLKSGVKVRRAGERKAPDAEMTDAEAEEAS
ncbi:MAG: efflux RND transporter periplasmic adaptor subunit [Thermoanaerobaculia bacterium]